MATLPAGAQVGTSSLRRRAQLAAARPDLRIVDIRGNVPTRLEKFRQGEVDAVVLALAGLKRLGLESHVSEVLDPEDLLPAPGQGALAVQIRRGDDRPGRLLAPLDHGPTRLATTTERALLGFLEGGCQVPIGALGQFDGSTLLLRAVVASPDGREVVKRRASGRVASLQHALDLGEALGRDLLDAGARGILERHSSGTALARRARGEHVVTGQRPIVANTRDEGPDGPLARALRRLGLESMSCPTIAIAPPDDPQPLRDALRGLATFDWVAFTSAHAVDAVSSHPEWQQAVEAGALPRVAAVGDASAARLAADRVMVDVVPDGVGAPALADAIARVAGVMRGVRVLWPRGDLAQMTLARGLGVRRRQRDGADRLSDTGAGRRIAGGVVRRARLESGGSDRLLLAVQRREPGARLGSPRPLDPAGPPAGRVDRADHERGAPHPWCGGRRASR